ncbi:heavy metal-associated isoprenylated plant protein 28 [Humulus lupulus]|uniref:heavy metal-associated isoprenylated plant protein 28 n=1 Tax=Humulus lupulus TaxID=3486 RepID=UPI002B408556|nr:heavy metal-associated isoprenylated plant protein 28 [Humulus lupulus]
MTIIEMRVHIDCAGCQSKVKSTLEKVKGVDDVDIDMNLQKVTVTGYADQKKILKAVRKTGRRAELWQLPYHPDDHSIISQHHFNGPVAHHAPQPSSSYNYYKHGYDNSYDRAQYYNPGLSSSTTIFGHQTGAAFSDENPHGCSIM